MTLAEIQATIDSERARLLVLKGKLTSSEFFKRKCEHAVQDRDFLQSFCGGKASKPSINVDLLQFSLQTVVNSRKQVEEAIDKFGPDVIAVPHDLENRR